MSNINVVRKNLGPVTAYKYAVQQGYTGTEQEFAALMASYATVAQEAEAAKDDAVDAKTAAEAAQAAAEAAAEQAEGAIEVDDTLSVEGRAADAKVTGDAIKNVESDLNITNSLVDDIASKTEDIVRAKLDFLIKTYSESGYSASQIRLASVQLPAGTYTIPSVDSDTYMYSVYTYISDSAGTLFYSYGSTGRTFTTQNPIVIVIRHITNQQVFTTDELKYFNKQFDVRRSNTVVFATKAELSVAESEIISTVDGHIGYFTEIKTFNIFDGTFPQTGYFDINGDESSTSFKRTDYIPIDDDGTLYFLRTAFPYLLVGCFYDSSKVSIGDSVVNIFRAGSSYTELTKSITIPAGAVYFRMYTNSTAYDGDLMLSYDYYDTFISYGGKMVLKDSSVDFDALDDNVKSAVYPLAGKTIAFMGDSIIGNIYDATGVCAVLAKITGATIINCAFGGTRMAYRYGSNPQYPYWNALSGVELANAIANDDWTEQDTAVINMTGGLAYFGARLATLKAVDWSAVDFIMWEYGTNDFMTEVALTGNDLYAYDYAYRHAIETILAAYPNIRIITVTPIYRWYQADGVYTEDSNTHIKEDYAGVSAKLTDFVAKAQEISKEYQLPCIDDYYTLGANQYTRLAYFDSTDGTHPNATGRKRIAEHIGAQLVSLV